MRAGSGFIVWLALVALTAPLAFSPCGAEGSLVMFASYEPGAYSPGEPFNFMLYVFYNGAAVSPTDPPRVMVMDDSGTPVYSVPVSSSGRGRFAGRYTVLAADAGRSGTVRLMADAGYGGDSGTAFETARAWMEIGLDAGLAPKQAPIVTARLMDSSDSSVLPGTKLAFECCVTQEGKPADPDGLVFRMRHSVAWPGDNSSIAPQRTGPGSYIVRYEIPRQNQSDRFFLDAGWANATGYQFTGAQVGLDLYQVVYHELGRTGTRVDYELFVSDRRGAAVNGSSVSIAVTPGLLGAGTGQMAGSAIEIDMGRTDSKGRVGSLLDLGGTGDVAYISGWANTSRFRQRFSGTVVLFGGLDGQQPVPAGGFRVVRTGLEGEALPGSTVRLGYRAFLDGRPLGDAPVDCYMIISRTGQPGTGIVSVNGQRLQTDDEGRLVLNISFPLGYASLATAAFVGPAGVTGARANDSDAIVAQPAAETSGSGWVNASLSRAEPGKRLDVTVRGAGLASAIAGWRIDHGTSGAEQRQWSAWTSMEWPLKEGSGGGPPYKGGVVIPSCIRAGINITVGLRLANSSGDASEASLPARVKAAQEQPSGNDLCCLAAAAVVNIGLFAFVLIQYNNAKKAPPPTQFGDRPVDERIGDILNPPGGQPDRVPTLPFKAELVQSVDCAICSRKIARGNMAWGCACGRKFHEHCLGDETKCAYCGRDWSKR